MRVETFKAWVIHKQPTGNTSVQVTFFTRERGLLRCLCKGGRNPKKQAVLQAFIPLCLIMDVRKERHYVRHIESIASSLEFKANSLFAGLYLNELLYYALQPCDPNPELFDVYHQSLQGLSNTTDKYTIEALLRQFEWALLLACGYAVSWTAEARLQIPIVDSGYYQFVADEGFILAHTGLAGRDILAFSKGELDNLTALKTAKWVMRQAIDHLLDGRQLKSRSLYKIKEVGI